MPELIWNGEGFLEEGGQTVPSGERFTVSEERAAQLHVLLGPQVADPGPADLMSLKRDALNDMASGAGVEAPEALQNKAAVVAAIEAAEAEPPTPEPVEGSDPTPDKED